MNKQSIEILNAIVNYNSINNGYDKRLVIIESRVMGFVNQKNCGPFVSFEDLTSGDFLEIYRYKKSLEESEDKKRK
ncbi:unnamed protein product [marine sediment metagenome]|uniref:Uncharacterized protein n=1 Tax=marine sediment metagenome TaxID=412755 RepID=X1NNT2_9ZZZZ